MTLTALGLPGPDAMRIGDPCPKCAAPLERRPRMFHWRGVFYDGAVCPANHGLWAIRGEEMPPLRPVCPSCCGPMARSSAEHVENGMSPDAWWCSWCEEY